MLSPTSTTLYLLSNVKLNNKYEHTLDFDNAITQQTYFLTKVSNHINPYNYTYMKKDNRIIVAANIDSLTDVNYLMYNNGSKWYYNFIISKEYKDPETTLLNIELDVYQTYMFDFSFNDTFVERSHLDRFYNDEGTLRPRISLSDESLELGSDLDRVQETYLYDKNTPLQQKYRQNEWEFSNDKSNIIWYYLVASYPLGNDSDWLGTVQNGVYQHTFVYCFPYYVRDGFTFDSELPKLALKDYANTTKLFPQDHHDVHGILDQVKVKSITISRYAPFDYTHEYIVENNNPYLLIKPVDVSGKTAADAVKVSHFPSPHDYIFALRFRNLPIRTVFESGEITFNPSSLSINNYVNINNETKLLSYPYSTIRIRANDTLNTLNQAFFENLNIKLGVGKSLSFKSNTMLVPQSYNSQQYNFDKAIYSIAENEMPLITDAWEQYESANKATLRSGLVTAGITAGASVALAAATGGLSLAIAGGAAISTGSNIANELTKRQNLKETPDDYRGSGDDVALKMQQTELYYTVEKLSVKLYYRYRAFKHFMHYGYKVSDYGVPALKSRYYYNYIKTIGANIEANIDQVDLHKLINIFDNGITIWHYRDPLTFKGIGVYEYENLETSIIQ